MSGDIQRCALDFVESFRPNALHITGQHMIPREILRVAEVQIQIPMRQDIPPLAAHARIHRGRRCLDVVARDASKHIEGKGAVKSMPIVEGPQADEQVAVDLVKFGTHSQVIVFGNGAARPYT
jgi:hypothetical protein